jgi:hypothetical protein
MRASCSSGRGDTLRHRSPPSAPSARRTSACTPDRGVRDSRSASTSCPCRPPTTRPKRLADVVVTCTTTTDTYALTTEAHGAARAVLARTGENVGAQLVIDLGMPRNVDPGLRSLPGIDVLDLDTIRVHAPIDEFATIDEARLIVRPRRGTRWRAACTRSRPRSSRCAATCTK